MSTPREHKTVHVRIFEYAEVIDWTIVCREEAEGDELKLPTDKMELKALIQILDGDF